MSKMRRRVAPGPFPLRLLEGCAEPGRAGPGPGLGALLFHFSPQFPLRGGRLQLPAAPGGNTTQGKRSFPIDRSPQGRAQHELQSEAGQWGESRCPPGTKEAPRGASGFPEKRAVRGRDPRERPPGPRVGTVPGSGALDPEAPRLVPGPPAWPALAPACRRCPSARPLGPCRPGRPAPRPAPSAHTPPPAASGGTSSGKGGPETAWSPRGRPRGGSAHPGTWSPPPALWCQAAG